MGTAKVQTFHSPDDLADAAARRWLQLALRCSKESPLKVAVSGGRFATTLFSRFAQLAPPTAGEQLQVFWADERCVPPQAEESNFRLAQDTLFRLLTFPAANIHRIRGEVDPARAAELAEAELRAWVLDYQGNTPILDLILLGMGEDGHVASLFPGEPQVMCGDPRLFRPVIGSKPPPQRVTLSYGAIAAARNVLILVTGAGKREALQRALDCDLDLPVSRVLQMREETDLLVWTA